MGSLPSQQWKLLELRPIERGRGRVISVANQKGGVAKTTTAVNVGTALALRGHKVLIVDVDPQANATTGLGLNHRAVEKSTYELLTGSADACEAVAPTAVANLECVPSSLDLAGAEVELAGEMAREKKLAEAIETIRDGYELVFVDCPPSLGLLTINALAASQDLMVPVQCEYYALEGLGQLLGTAERVRRSLNADLRIAGFLLTMYDARTKLSGQVAAEVRRHFGDLVYETVIPRSVRLSEAPSFGEPVLTLDAASRGAVAYRLMAVEMESRYGLEVHVPPPPGDRVPAPSRPREETKAPAGHPEPRSSRTSVPGAGGRGYGTVSARPPHLEEAWPPRRPFTDEVSS